MNEISLKLNPAYYASTSHACQDTDQNQRRNGTPVLNVIQVPPMLIAKPRFFSE